MKTIKTITPLLVLAVSLSSFAGPTDRSIDNKLESLNQAQQDGLIQMLDNSKKQSINDYLGKALSVIRNGIHRPGRNGDRDRRDWRRGTNYHTNEVIAYKDDHCTDTLIEIKDRDQCSNLVFLKNERVWSTKINGICINTSDTTFGRKCEELINLANAQKPISNDLIVYTDDRCSTTLTTIDPYMDCEALGAVLNNHKIWSVKFENKCINIPDTTMSVNKCMDYQEAILSNYENDGRRRGRGEIELYYDDRCTQLLTNVDRSTDCTLMDHIYNSQKVWSIKHRGQCINIADTTFLNACKSYSHN